MYTLAVIPMHAERWRFDRNSSMLLTQQMCGVSSLYRMSSLCRTSMLQSFNKVACSRIVFIKSTCFSIARALCVDTQKCLVVVAA